MMRAFLAVLLTLGLLGVAIPSAEAASRWRTTTVVSTQEGCGPAGLTLTATWRPTRSGVLLRSVLVDNDDRYAPMVPSLSVTADGVLAYAGPNGHGRVGDGLDYEWIRGWERNVDGLRVRLGSPVSEVRHAAGLHVDGESVVAAALCLPDPVARTICPEPAADPEPPAPRHRRAAG